MPLLVALSASGGTAAVWFSPDKRQRAEETRLGQQVKKLEERVIALETIYISLPDVEKTRSLPETNNRQP